ncbi:hypothetical protein TSH100_13900 [Azospirillum sp. TSH100]|uniref:hypothetical protein n=1 Tax=Azospirillum sp. TSH100 TaxID=652764 RepID=UPI000D615040|nr:hypothetical protein [Azospirillum sp. TSH100]PWC86062.1 hypothetical protein TSH100_13900 [Azospirillum sp. TSH100]QCG89361.1 hypothetical protein E6C72_16355 [Azospirillum sp. TSH100]
MRTEWDGVLCLQLGLVDRQFDARIVYQAGPFRADIRAIEIRTAQGWLPVPWLLDLVEDSAPLFDMLRDHAAGRTADARRIARGA